MLPACLTSGVIPSSFNDGDRRAKGSEDVEPLSCFRFSFSPKFIRTPDGARQERKV